MDFENYTKEIQWENFICENTKVGLKSSQSLAQSLIDTYGSTDDISDAAFILPDGEMVKLDRHLLFHIAMVKEAGGQSMSDLWKNGIVRVNPGVGVEMGKAPTRSQLDIIEWIADSVFRFSVDLHDGSKKASRSYSSPKPDRVLADIKKFYQDGQMTQASTIAKFHTGIDESKKTDCANSRSCV